MSSTKGIRAQNQQKGKRQLSQAAGREIPTRYMEEIKRSPFCAQALEWVPQRCLVMGLVMCALELFRACPEVPPLTVVLVL